MTTYSTGEICVTHQSCDGTESDCLTERGTRPIQPEQIKALRAEAGAAGDLAQVAICDRALLGDVAAINECARVIRAAQQ